MKISHLLLSIIFVAFNILIFISNLINFSPLSAIIAPEPEVNLRIRCFCEEFLSILQFLEIVYIFIKKDMHGSLHTCLFPAHCAFMPACAPHPPRSAPRSDGFLLTLHLRHSGLKILFSVRSSIPSYPNLRKTVRSSLQNRRLTYRPLW